MACAGLIAQTIADRTIQHANGRFMNRSFEGFCFVCVKFRRSIKVQLSWTRMLVTQLTESIRACVIRGGNSRKLERADEKYALTGGTIGIEERALACLYQILNRSSNAHIALTGRDSITTNCIAKSLLGLGWIGLSQNSAN